MTRPRALTRGLILVVDDQASTVRMLARYLRSCGHIVAEAADPEQAIDHLRSDTYDAILCDIHIPGMSGLELAHQFREDTPRTALILMTGDPDDRVEELARRAGAVGYLRKPFSFVELDETLARVMIQR
jgi:two-component system sensor histidine kinase RpfC